MVAFEDEAAERPVDEAPQEQAVDADIDRLQLRGKKKTKLEQKKALEHEARALLATARVATAKDRVRVQ